MATAPNNWERLKDIVADALDVPAGEHRERVLRDACGEDHSLLASARELLDAYDDSDGVIDQRTDAWLGLGGPDVLSLGGQRIGRFKLERVLGEGAMSAVYVARQANPDRLVALKIFRTALPLIDARQRFRREAQALARLRHPNIAAIYEAGLHETNDNRAIPYLAIEYVDGVPIHDFADDRRLDRHARIELLIKVALAVQAAHQQTIIHCDLKPPNILVDTEGEPRVLDFGIARMANVDAEHAATWQTTGGLLMGTPGYMSPEQCAPSSVDGVDVRADVWALGVILYQLLLGRLPIETSGASITEVLRKMEGADITPPRQLDPTLSGDLETILLTALRKEKSRRYATAQALADDLRRYLEQRPIEARPPTRAYLFTKFARRNRGTLAVAVLVTLLILATAILSSIGFVRASRERARAERERDRAVVAEKRARGVSDFLVEMIGAPDPISGRRDVTVLDMLRQNERQIEARFKDDPSTATALHDTIGWTFFSLSEFEAAAEHLRKAIAIAEATVGPRDAQTIGLKCRLVTILRWQFKSDEAKALLDATLPIAESGFGHESAVTFPLLDNAAGLAYDANDFATAAAAYRDVYELGRRVFGSDDNQTLTAGNNLALSLIELGRYAEAVAVLRDVLARLDRLFGPDSARANVPRNNLATALLYLGNIAEARRIQDRLIDVTARKLGPEHDDTLAARLRMADILRNGGDYDRALAILKEVYEVRERKYGASHPITLSSRGSYLVVLAESNRTVEAEAFARELSTLR